jgi:TLD
MKSDHPLVLLRQQYQIYFKNLINWDVFLAQALDFVLASGKDSYIDSPLISSSHTDIHHTIKFSGEIPTLSEPSKLLSEIMILQIVEKLPNYLKYRDWDLIYSTVSNGWSLNTFYRNCENYGSNILVIKDHSHYIFGGFASQSWIHCKKFYGNGECFVYTFENQEEIKCYYASLNNDFYMSSDSQCLIMGGG